MENTDNDDARKKVWELIKDIRIAQLVTHAEGGFMSARPMSAMNTEFDGTLWFFAKSHSPKMEEIEVNPHVLLSYSHPSKQEYVALQGKAELLNDRQKIKDLWSEFARIWFPKGSEDPTLRLIKVEVLRAEYWDSSSSTLKMIYGYAKARITGEVPEIGENKKVAF